MPKRKTVEQKPRRFQLEGKTENQRELIRAIYDNEIVICTGPSGTGKSMISCGIACKMLLDGEIEQIVTTRPLVATGKDIGFLPGDVGSKIMPYLLLCEEYFKLFLGNDTYQRLVDTGKIRFLPLELMRGSTFHRAFMILDEAQNCTSDQIKMFITRMGEDSVVFVNGDIKQSDLRNSGLEYVKRKLNGVDGISINELEMSDIQRNGLIGKVLQALDD